MAALECWEVSVAFRDVYPDASSGYGVRPASWRVERMRCLSPSRSVLARGSRGPVGHVVWNRCSILDSMVRRSQRRYNIGYYRRNRDHEIARVRTRQDATLAFLRELRRLPCADCRRTFAPHQMDFDHRGDEPKSFNLTAGRAMLKSRQALLDEARKCDIVCANCHRIRTQVRHARREIRSVGTSPYLERKRANWRAHAVLLDRMRDVPCADCHERFPPSAMHFDHRDPTTKQYTVSKMISRSGAARILDEIAKCDIVCANCHRLRTFNRRMAVGGKRE